MTNSTTYATSSTIGSKQAAEKSRWRGRAVLGFMVDRKKHNPVAIVLLVAYVVEFVILAIHPYARDVWFVENVTILPIVVLLTVMYVKGSRFSTIAYILMAFLIF